MRVSNPMVELPDGAFSSYGEALALKFETPTPSVARLIDIERTVWDPDYRRWAIDQLSKEDHA